MSTIQWRGDATAVAQVTRVTPGNVEVGDVFTLTVGNKSVSYTAAVGTVADVTAGLTAAWNSASAAELSEVTATDDTTHMTLTADVAGVPFTVSAAATDGGGADTQTLTVTTLTPSAGPLHWDTPANWSGGTVPVTGDTVHVEHSSASIRYGLNQSAVTLASLHIAASFTGEIGLPRDNTSGATSYVEYRPRYLQVSCTDLTLGRGTGEGSPQILLDTGSNRTTIVVESTGTTADETLPPVLWKGTHANSELHLRSGRMGVALFGSETATLSTITQTGGRVELGSGVTLSSLSLTGNGYLQVRSFFSTLNLTSGEVLVLGSAAAVTVNANGGRLDWRSDGSITTLNVTNQEALVDFSHDGRARSVANCTLTQGQIIDPLRSVTYGSGIEPGGSIQARDAA